MSHGAASAGWAIFVLVLSFAACRTPERGQVPAPAPAPGGEPAPRADGATQDAATQDAATQDAATQDAATQDAATQGAAPQGAAAQDPATQEAPPPKQPRWPVQGYLSTRYRFRTTDDENDQDLDVVLGLRYGDPQAPGVSAHVMARGAADLDGATASDPFFSLDDTYESSLTGRLYYAWVDFRPENPEPGHVERYRVGRQIDYFTPEVVTFDGVSATTREAGSAKFQAGMYGGVPVHHYEETNSGDALFGLFAQGRPWKDGRLRADWMHLNDDTRLTTHDNDLLSLGLWQRAGQAALIEGRYTHLDEEPRDARAQVSWSNAESGLTLFASYYELLRTQRGLSQELDPFFTTLMAQFPYRQARALASKSLGDFLLLQGGIDVRRMADEDDVGQFNRDFERGFATVTLGEPLPWELSLSLSGEVWNSEDSDVETWGADLAKSFGRAFDASLGSYYALFKYDLFSIEERDDVRTYYCVLRWKRNEAGSFDLRYEWEDSDLGDFHTLRLGALWRF